MKFGGWSLPALVVCLCFCVALLLMGRIARGDDLASSYIAGRIVLTEDQGRLYNHDPVHFDILGDPVLIRIAHLNGFAGPPHPFVQTPLWALMVRPLATCMSYPEFRISFHLINVLVLAGIIMLTARMWAPIFRNPVWLAGILLILIVFEPTQYTLFLSQTHPIFIFLTLLAVFLADRGRNVWAGLALALAAAVKITPAFLVLYWLLSRRFRASVSFFLWSGGLAAATLAIVGLKTMKCYLGELERISSVLLSAFNNQSLAAFLSDFGERTRGHYNTWEIQPLPLGTKIISMCCIVLIIVILARIRGRIARPAAGFEGLAVSGVLVSMTVFTPIAWSHYFIILIVPLMVLIQHSLDTRRWWQLPILALCTALNIHPVAVCGAEGDLAQCLIIRSHFASGMLLLAMVIMEAWRMAAARDGGSASGKDAPTVMEHPSAEDGCP
jgi:hypothetical protein